MPLNADSAKLDKSDENDFVIVVQAVSVGVLMDDTRQSCDTLGA